MESFGKSDAGCDQQESPLVTPYNDWDCDTFVTSMMEEKKEEDSRSHSSSSWDLELDDESVIPPSAILLYEDVSVNVGVEGLSKCIQLNEKYIDQYGSYDDLLKKFIENEEELRVSNYKLEHSEEEISKLKIQIEQCEGQLDDVKNALKLKEDNVEQSVRRLDDVEKELKLKENDLEYEKGQVQEMRKQNAELATLCCYKITKFEKMLEVVANEQLKVSSNEIARLTKELGSKLSEIHELQGLLKVAEECVAKLECEFDSGRKHIQDLENMIAWYKSNEANLELEVQKLKAEMVNMKEEFSLEKDKLYFDIQSLSKANEELNSINNEYENKLMQSAIANSKDKEYHATLKKALKGEIDSLKEEVRQKKHDVEAVNKEFDVYKQKFDMLVIEKEEADAKIISQEDHFKKVISKALNKLRLSQVLKVDELEKEVNRQKGVISNLKEEKKEAIRELCLSIENYKTKYQQLVQESDRSRCMFF